MPNLWVVGLTGVVPRAQAHRGLLQGHLFQVLLELGAPQP